MVKERITKKDFERKLMGKSVERLVAEPHTEYSGGTVAHMTLYYDGDKHIATWQSGEGWIFD